MPGVAEPLKNRFGADVPGTIARSIAAVSSAFPGAAFVEDALAGYDALDLTTRRHYAGTHRVDILVNGRTLPLGSFELTG